SNQGWGPWEVNLSYILNFGTAADPFGPQNLAGYVNDYTTKFSGVYGATPAPPPPEWTSIFWGNGPNPTSGFSMLPTLPTGVNTTTTDLVPPSANYLSKTTYGRYGPDGFPDNPRPATA